MILSERYREALGFAFDLHKEQTRQGSGVPYVAHLVGVSSLALEYGADEDEAIAALLHDAVEDQGGRETLNQIRGRFGEKVASIVAGCTDAVDPPKPPWRKRKENYLEHLRTADRSVQLVSACDKLYNARAIVSDYRKVGESLWSRFSGGRDGVLWYYQALARVFPPDLEPAQELGRAVEEMVRLSGSPRP
jgi:(p)ppGpp synthase/HD superfamily hydrolase